MGLEIHFGSKGQRKNKQHTQMTPQDKGGSEGVTSSSGCGIISYTPPPAKPLQLR